MNVKAAMRIGKSRAVPRVLLEVHFLGRRAAEALWGMTPPLLCTPFDRSSLAIRAAKKSRPEGLSEAANHARLSLFPVNYTHILT
jgi:hypothetical protein